MNFLLLTSLLFSFSTYASNCSDLANDCEFYTCISQEKHCSPRSYPLNFGLSFCLRYESRTKLFSREGKAWIEEVRKCLINEMDQMDDTLSCRQLKSAAFKTHVPCYVKNGICKLSFHDQKAILMTIWPSLKNARVQANGLQVLKQCSNLTRD